MKRKPISGLIMNVFIAVVMMVSMGITFATPAMAQIPQCINPDCENPNIYICEGMELNDQLLLDNDVGCDPAPGHYNDPVEGPYDISVYFDFIQDPLDAINPVGPDLEGTAPAVGGPYIYHVHCEKDRTEWGDQCRCDSLGYIWVVECVCNADDFTICVGDPLSDELFITLGNAACTGEFCNLVDIDYSAVNNSEAGVYPYTVYCDSEICEDSSCTAYVTVEECEECCDCYAPDISICQGDELTEQDIIDAGASCGAGCTMTLDISGVDTEDPGDYIYTVMCEGDCGCTECTGTVTVVPACMARAPDFSICQFASEEDLEAAAKKAGAKCTEGCDPDFKFWKVDTCVPGVYEYCLSCADPCVDGCPDGCGDDEVCGMVTVIPCMEVTIIECPEMDYPDGIVPVSTNFVIKAEIENCSESILHDVVAHIEITTGIGSVEVLDPMEWPLGNMAVNGRTTVAWNLHCTAPGAVEVKVWTNECGYDTCCFRQALPPNLSATCEAPCDVCVNCSENEYQFCATVKNNGDCAIEFVEGTLSIFGPAMRNGQPAKQDVVDLLGPGESQTICWDIKCTGEGPVTFSVVFNGIDQCDQTTEIVSNVCETVTQQENIIVDIECVKGLLADQDFTQKVDFTPACDSTCLEDPKYSVGDCDNPDPAMYDIVSTLQPFMVKATVKNCLNALQDMDINLLIPAGTQLYPGSWVKVYIPSVAQTYWYPANATIYLEDVCACCSIEVTWILKCTGSSDEDKLPLEVQVQTYAPGGAPCELFSNMCCHPAYVIQEAKVHLDAAMYLYVEDCDSECMVPVDAVTMCQEYDIKIGVTNLGEADAYDVGMNINVAGDTTCVGTYSSVMLAGFPDVDGKTWSRLCGGETHYYWLSTLISCELKCTSIDDVTITIPDLYGYDENTCEPVLEDNIEDICPLVIHQPNVWVEIVNPDPEECNKIYEYEVFAVKARIYNCGPYDINDVVASLCWETENGRQCGHGPDLELVEGSDNPKLIPLIPAPDKDCCEIGDPCGECMPTVYEVSWMVRCLNKGPISFFVCLEAANPHLQVSDIGYYTGDSSNRCCLTCDERDSNYIWPVTVYQKERRKANACVQIVSPDIGAKYATSQEFAVTAIIKNLEESETITIDEARLKIGNQFCDMSLGDGIDVIGDPMPLLPWVIAPGESKTVTWTTHCNESGLSWFKVKLAGETDVQAAVWEMSEPVWVWQYPAAHLEVNITQYPTQPIATSTVFPVTATITNTGEADATEVYATISVQPEDSVRVAGPSADGYTQFIGTIPGHGSEANSVEVTWNLHCKMPCDSTIKITATGADEYGYHIKQECANTGSFIIENGFEIIEGLYEEDPAVNKGWFTGYYVGDANGMTGPFNVNTPISWAGIGGGPDFTGNMVGMGTIISNIPPEMADFLSGVGPCCHDRTCVGKDLMVFIGHITTDSSADMLPPWSIWEVSPGLIQVINGTITGVYDIHMMYDSNTCFIKSLLGGTYCTNLAAEPGRAILAGFIEPDEITVKQLPVLVDLDIEKAADSCCYTMGEIATFTIMLTNIGPSRATSVLVMDVLPAELGFEGYTASQGWYDETSGYWSVGDLAASEIATLIIETRVNTVGEVCNRAIVVALNEHDPITTNNMAEACINSDEAEPTESVTLNLDSGYNLISLPLIPDVTDPVVALTGVDFSVAAMYQKSAEAFRSYVQAVPPPQAGFVWDDGLGYWLNMNSADTLDVAGIELVSGPVLPPSYEVFGKGGIYTTGWNLIGFKSVASKLPSEYLAGVAGKWVMIYGFDNGAFFAVGSPGHAMLQPGFGYWLAIRDGESGTIFP